MGPVEHIAAAFHAGFDAGFAVSGEGYNAEHMAAPRRMTSDEHVAWCEASLLSKRQQAKEVFFVLPQAFSVDHARRCSRLRSEFVTRQLRTASAFEELYCQIRDMADDFHRESIRRRDGHEPGQVDVPMLDRDQAIESTFRLAYDRMADLDY